MIGLFIRTQNAVRCVQPACIRLSVGRFYNALKRIDAEAYLGTAAGEVEQHRKAAVGLQHRVRQRDDAGGQAIFGVGDEELSRSESSSPEAADNHGFAEA